jgi:hypothetical protein
MSNWTPARAITAASAGLLLLLPGCGGSSPRQALRRETAAAGPTVVTTAPGSTGVTSVSSPSATGAPSTTVSKGAGAQPKSAAAPPSAAPKGAPPKPPTAATGPSGPSPTQPGTYTYRQAGQSTGGGATTSAPGQGTLLVDRADAHGQQQSHRVTSPGQSSTDTTFNFPGNGMFIVSEVLHTATGGQQVTFTCPFDGPMPAPPWPPAVGATFSGHANCGAFTLDANGRITGTRDVALDGTTLHTFVVETAIATHGQVESTGSQVDWFSPLLRLPVHSESRQQGTYGFFSFSSDLTSDLVSGRPS